MANTPSRLGAEPTVQTLFLWSSACCVDLSAPVLGNGKDGLVEYA